MSFANIVNKSFSSKGRKQMNTGKAADAATATAKRIRYYKQIGLVNPAPHTDAGVRQACPIFNKLEGVSS